MYRYHLHCLFPTTHHGIVRIGAAHIQPVPVPDGLNNPDMVAAVEALGLALGDAGSDVVGLQQQAVVLAAGGAHVPQVHPEDPVHRANVQRVSRLVHEQRSAGEGAGVNLTQLARDFVTFLTFQLSKTSVVEP
jgi:hypothetical protein